MKKFVNLTPHTIKIFSGDTTVEIEPSGIVARVVTEEERVGEINGIPLISRKLGEPENIPAPQDGVVYIVSAMVLNAIADRNDVVAPDTGATAIRDDAGRIMAVTRLVTAGS